MGLSKYNRGKTEASELRVFPWILTLCSTCPAFAIFRGFNPLNLSALSAFHFSILK